MANIYDNSIGGGGYPYGGYGGCGYGGFPAFGLFGALPLGGGYGGYGGYGGNCCPIPTYDICGKDKCHDHCNGNGRHSEEVILEDAHHSSILSKLCDLDKTCCKTDYAVAINAKDVIKNTDDRFAQLDKDILVNRYELSKQISDCCCETQKNITELKYDFSKQLAQCCCDLKGEFKDAEINRLKDENNRFHYANIANGAAANAIASFRAASAGNIFAAPGSTLSSSTNNNSGQINSAGA